MRLLIVEDELRMASLIRRGLVNEGLAADVAVNGEEALWMAEAADYDAIVLDVMLPGMSGFETCRRLRNNGVWVPVLMLTARDSVDDRVAGLDTGADDYLVKPFAFAELLARLRALARRGELERPSVLEIGDLRLDPATHRVWRGPTEIRFAARATGFGRTAGHETGSDPAARRRRVRRSDGGRARRHRLVPLHPSRFPPLACARPRPALARAGPGSAHPRARSSSCGRQRRAVRRGGRGVRPAARRSRPRSRRHAPAPDQATLDRRRAARGTRRHDHGRSSFGARPRRAVAAARQTRGTAWPEARARRGRHARGRRRDARRPPLRAPHRRADCARARFGRGLRAGRLLASRRRVHAPPCRGDLGRDAGRPTAGAGDRRRG